VAQIEFLPPDQQDAIAEAMRRELEEREWDILLATPGSRRALTRLAAEARHEGAAGGTHESGECR
jgi:hypothetical protein